MSPITSDITFSRMNSNHDLEQTIEASSSTRSTKYCIFVLRFCDRALEIHSIPILVCPMVRSGDADKRVALKGDPSKCWCPQHLSTVRKVMPNRLRAEDLIVLFIRQPCLANAERSLTGTHAPSYSHSRSVVQA